MSVTSWWRRQVQLLHANGTGQGASLQPYVQKPRKYQRQVIFYASPVPGPGMLMRACESKAAGDQTQTQCNLQLVGSENMQHGISYTKIPTLSQVSRPLSCSVWVHGGMDCRSPSAIRFSCKLSSPGTQIAQFSHLFATRCSRSIKLMGVLSSRN